MSYCLQLVDVKRSDNQHEATDCCPVGAKKCLIIKPCGPSGEEQGIDEKKETSCCSGQIGQCLIVKPCAFNRKTEESDKREPACCSEAGKCGKSGESICIKLSELNDSTCIMVKPGDFGQPPVCVCVC